MAARSTGATIPSTKAISLGEGYEIGDEVKKERLAGGWRRVGWKLGFTNMALWPTQGVDARQRRLSMVPCRPLSGSRDSYL